MHTVATLIARVAEAADVVFILRRLALKIGAGQVVEQHVVFDAEEVLPLRAQVIEQLPLVLQNHVQNPVERILGGQGVVLAQQVSHRGVSIPVAVQAPLAAGINQPVGYEHFEHMLPVGAFPRTSQLLPPKLPQIQLLP